MAQSRKGELWGQLKAAGIEFPKHYREYTVDQLELAVAKLHEPEPEPEPQFDARALAAAREALLEEAPSAGQLIRSSQPAEHAGLTANSHRPEEPVRVDPETGFLWYVDEVRKAAFPKPRGRRVLRYQDTGVKTVEVRSGEYTEGFEMPGNDTRIAEARITLPSYQVGLYKDPGMPFKIHVYNEERGFDLFEVQDYYNGPDLVPAGIKRKYVSNVLCYDIRTTIRAIEAELREQELAGLHTTPAR